MHFIVKFFDSANQCTEAVNRQIIYITQSNLNLGLDLAKSLASTRDPSEIVRLQASYWWKQLNEFTTQAEEVRKRLFGFSAAPEPRLSDPAQELITRPHQQHNPAAQEPATGRPKPKPENQHVETLPIAAKTNETADSKVGRPKPSIQSSSAVENRSTSARSTSGDPARKRAERKPQARGRPQTRSRRWKLLNR
jgi:Phasin protein